MKHITPNKTFRLIILATSLSFATTPVVHANSNDGTVGAIIGGSVGAIAGGGLDNRGSNKDGVLIGAAVGGTLGYIIGSSNGKHDDDYRRQYSGYPGEYYEYRGRGYRRYRNDQHGYISILITPDDPYYYRDGRRRSQSHYSRNSRSYSSRNRGRSGYRRYR